MKFIKKIWPLCILSAVLIVAVSAYVHRGADFTGFAARRLSRVTESRIGKLQSYMNEALGQKEWHSFDKMPDDMVIYRYVDDSLRSWSNQFTTDNDDIGKHLYFKRFTGLRLREVSSLADVDTALTYINMGQNWYLAKSVSDGDVKVIGGLLIKGDPNGGSGNGVNRKLHLSEQFSLYPISYAGGVPVAVSGVPMFKVIQENVRSVSLMPDPVSIWVAVFLLVIAALFYLRSHRNFRGLIFTITWLTVVCGVFYCLGRHDSIGLSLFSPIIYADGPVFYSLGAVLVINLYLLSVVTSVYICRRLIFERLFSCATPRKMALHMAAVTVLLLGILAHGHISLKSIMINSNITLALFKVGEISRYTIYVIASYIGLLMTMPLLLQMLRPPVKYFTGRRFNPLSSTWKMILSVFIAVYVLSLSFSQDMRREKSRAEIWASRLAIDRNISFELQLKQIEKAIADDFIVNTIVKSGQNYALILNRISETYFSRISQEYDVNLFMAKSNNIDPEMANYISSRVRDGVPIADSSRFVYSRSGNGIAQYTGSFIYPETSTAMFISLDSKLGREERGYTTIFGFSDPGKVEIPQNYSYARYLDGNLISFKGDYAYPTILSGKLEESVLSGSDHVDVDHYSHFITRIAGNEVVVVSRRKTSSSQYIVSGFVIILLVYLCISVLSMRNSRSRRFERNYYKSRINTVLFFSLLLTLLSMAGISILFVYRRNDANVSTLVKGKISTIQSLLASSCRFYSGTRDLSSQEFKGLLDNVSEFTRSDVTVYSPDGKYIRSTCPEIYDRLLMGCRMNSRAYYNIIGRYKNFYINKEKANHRSYYAMYAPIFNAEGTILGIVCAPYTDSALDFKVDAVLHTLFILTVFFILLIFMRFVNSKVVDRMFSPLLVMGRKMNEARTRGLEYIIYDRDDEIATLVRAYNLMVHDLSESGKQVAQAERDKAWSEMARQVAHEIKNPLTPIKLQIQRVIRLKQKNDPQWEDKFEAIAPVILESIDELTDTANEFSTFARLYNEEPVSIDLDRLARDEISLFDEKENISFRYMGLQDSVVMGPKPQLTRVFVNILTNAVQAIENQQSEDAAAGREPALGLVQVSLRHSTRDGFYDIVFEDNGPGVTDANRPKLFTPKFTTKSSGTGLGLAICKNIIERCGGEIIYSKSFALQGACFTVRYPK